MTLIIAGERSGVGKTTVTLALLACLSQQQNKKVQSFKVGPDYIDPMFHQRVTGVSCRNLDPVLTSETYVQSCFDRHTQGVDYALIEGVMGLFDGASGQDDFASTAHIARLLNTPIVLVLDCSKLSRSVAAIAHGYRTFDPRITIAGVVLNRVGSDRHLELLTEALEPLRLPILGILRRQDTITIPDRHLGLVPTAELTDLDPLIDELAYIGKTCFNWDLLLPWLTPPCNTGAITTLYPQTPIPHLSSPIKIALACDQAFSFYYQDNLDCFNALGAELIPWSPLTDAPLPAGIKGLYLGGGFPEVFAEPLAKNHQAREAVRQAILRGMPTYAECGGLMYLCEQIIDFADHSWPMVGILPTTAVMGKRLTLGYRQAKTLQNSVLLPAGDIIWGHEFHRSQLTTLPKNPLFELQNNRFNQENPRAVEGWHIHQLHASYIHWHWGSRFDIPARFLSHCQQFNP